jgi:RHS repeat-associated protein
MGAATPENPFSGTQIEPKCRMEIVLVRKSFRGTSGPETVWLGDLPIAVVKATATYYVHADYQNTPRQIDNASGQAVWTWEPVTFGANAPNTDPLNTGTSFDYKVRFPGQVADTEPELRYNYFRDYNPTLGRYVQSDPIGLIGGIDTYGYVRNTPVSSYHPMTGLGYVPS